MFDGSYAFSGILRGKLYLVDFNPEELELDKCLISKMSYPVFMPKPSSHRMHDLGSIVPHMRPKCSQITKCHKYKV
jgi:hypothetical protein